MTTQQLDCIELQYPILGDLAQAVITSEDERAVLVIAVAAHQAEFAQEVEA